MAPGFRLRLRITCVLRPARTGTPFGEDYHQGMAAQTLELPVTLQRCAGCEDDCTHCIQQRLARRPGIRSVRVDRAASADNSNDQAGTLSLEYDPSLLSLAQVNALLRQAGGCLSDHLAHVVLRVEGMVSPRQERPIETALGRIAGVRAIASYASGTVRLEFDRQRCALPQIVDELDSLGVRLAPIDKPAPAAARALPTWLSLALSSRELVFACIGACFLLAGAIVHWTDGAPWLRLALLLPAYVLCGWHAAIDTFKTLRCLRFDIDVLMVAAALGAALLGHVEEGALLLLLFALGGAGEELAIGRARRAIQALTQLAPTTATRLSPDGETREVRVEDLRVGDRILVQPGRSIGADGTVVAGASAVDQSPITGESVPVEKVVEDAVFAGTINGQGALTVAVTRMASDNTLAKVIRLVEEAQSTKSPTQRFTDRIEQWYVPAVLAMTAGLIVLPPLLGLPSRRHPDSIWAGWFYQAMAFLTAASPCALAIGTPATVLSGIARAARGGVLVKGGAHLENMGRIATVAFDKTGTLTHGKPAVTDVVALGGPETADDLLALAAAAERVSHHPLAAAIVAEADARHLPRHDAHEAVQSPGLGVRARVLGRDVAVGRLAMFGATGPAEALVAELERKGLTVACVSLDGQVRGLVALADRPRPGAREAIARLRDLGVKRTIMLTGDNAAVAQSVAGELGIDEVAAELMPDAKLEHVRRLDERYGRVAMVGDGVNDAPAMANATVGIAMGAASGGGAASDVALETADVVLMTDDLARLPEALGVARAARRIIVQNLVIALGVMMIVAPVAAMGLTNIAAAVTLHEGSTVLVVINALRLLGYRAR